MTVKALILAAGLGTRLRPLTDRVPKCLVPIAERPLLSYWVDALDAAGIRSALINTHHLPEQVEAYAAEVRLHGRVDLQTVSEPELLGSAGTIRANRAWMDDAEACVIIYADNLSDVPLTQLLDEHRSHDEPFTMMLFRAEHPEQCGIAELDDDGLVVSFVEKPERPVSDLANAGVYVVSADAFREIADMSVFDIGHEVLPTFVGRMRGWTWDGYHRDIGTPDALNQATRDVETWLCEERRG